MRSRMSFPSVFVDFQAMFRRICKRASGTQQRAESPLESLIWYRKRFISYSSSSLCRKAGGLLWWDRVKTKILCQRKNGTSLAIQWLRVWALIPGSPCHAVQWKEKRKVLKKKEWGHINESHMLLWWDHWDIILRFVLAIFLWKFYTPSKMFYITDNLSF